MDTGTDPEPMVQKLQKDEAQRRIGAVRRHLHGLHQPQADSRRAD